MSLLYGLFALMNYRDRRRQLDETLLNEMKIFSFKPLGGRFEVAFEEKKKGEQLWHLVHSPQGPYALFEIPGSRKFRLRIRLPQREYDRRIAVIRQKALRGWPLYLSAIALLALLFAYYSLSPYRRALRLNEEFIRDILHDFNTPLSALRIDLGILRRRLGENRNVERMLTSLDIVHALQENLRAFLARRPGGRERFGLRSLLEERIDSLRGLYPSLHFQDEVPAGVTLLCDRDAFARIVENLLSNACKYNREGGRVRIELNDTLLKIRDNGRGMREPDRAFDRYYREGERGLGLGLHIVKKLAGDMRIGLKLESREGEGTTVSLDLREVMQR